MIRVADAFIVFPRRETSFDKLVSIFGVLPSLSDPSPDQVAHVDERIEKIWLVPTLRKY
jgi:hypothetical protein